MAFRDLRSLAFVSLSLVACQRLEVAEDTGNALTFSDTTGTSSSGGAETSSGGEVEEGNDTNQPPEFDCDPVMQTGCNGDEKCTAVVSGGLVAYVCANDPADLDPYESCTAEIGSGIDGCQAGYVCIADELDAGICEPLCIGTNDCTDAVCINEPLHNIPYCANECSPFEGGCIAPTQCRRGDDRFACEFPHADDIGGQGEPCTPQSDAGCGEGYVCIAGALVPDCTTDSCCTTVCDLSDDICDAPSTCTAVFSAPAPGAENIGACLVPA
ncbi:MAG TPA: hypothetical protein VG755_39470 [Nannocystaceae bacterium]|nr:hypothetical protein [Nannocystaceae bacterium]